MAEVLGNLCGDVVRLHELDVQQVVEAIPAEQLDLLGDAGRRVGERSALEGDHLVDELLRHRAVGGPLSAADEGHARVLVVPDGVVAAYRRVRRRVRVSVERPPPLPRRDDVGAAEADVGREARRGLVDEVLDLVLRDVRRGGRVALLVGRANHRVAQPRQKVHRRAARVAQLAEAHAARSEVAGQDDVAAGGGGDRLVGPRVFHAPHRVEEGAGGEDDRLCLHHELLARQLVNTRHAGRRRAVRTAVHEPRHLDIVCNCRALHRRGERDGGAGAGVVVHRLAVDRRVERRLELREVLLCLTRRHDVGGRRVEAGEQVVEDKGGVGEDRKDGVEGVVEVRRPLDQRLEGHRLRHVLDEVRLLPREPRALLAALVHHQELGDELLQRRDGRRERLAVEQLGERHLEVLEAAPDQL
mmetsp:Transcript_25469/g.84847  ORF Transcript_25469/g.84847 Transcript_25469/m.84847 type:complete len:414 (+) Transcript_25469:931-2172(+)